jgi:septum formation protein
MLDTPRACAAGWNCHLMEDVPAPPPFILASGSATRLRVLRDAGFDPVVVVSGVPEEVDGIDTARAVVLLAARKGAAVAQRRPDALILACDSMLELEGTSLGKPASAAEAIAMWQRLAGSRGTLHTGHCLIDTRSGISISRLDSTVVRFGRPTEAEISAYVDSGEALSLAGAFSIDGRAAPFVDGIEGVPSNVLGVSLPVVRGMLREAGISLTDLWTDPRG